MPLDYFGGALVPGISLILHELTSHRTRFVWLQVPGPAASSIDGRHRATAAAAAGTCRTDVKAPCSTEWSCSADTIFAASWRAWQQAKSDHSDGAWNMNKRTALSVLCATGSFALAGRASFDLSTVRRFAISCAVSHCTLYVIPLSLCRYWVCRSPSKGLHCWEFACWQLPFYWSCGLRAESFIHVQ